MKWLKAIDSIGHLWKNEGRQARTCIGHGKPREMRPESESLVRRPPLKRRLTTAWQTRLSLPKQMGGDRPAYVLASPRIHHKSATYSKIGAVPSKFRYVLASFLSPQKTRTTFFGFFCCVIAISTPPVERMSLPPSCPR